MDGPIKSVVTGLLLILAVSLSVVFTQWGNNLENEPILTIASGSDQVLASSENNGLGIYSGSSGPWISTFLGLLVPLGCLGLMTYILVRKPLKTSGS